VFQKYNLRLAIIQVTEIMWGSSGSKITGLQTVSLGLKILEGVRHYGQPGNGTHATYSPMSTEQMA